MKIIHGGRAFGKTTELIKQSSLKNIPIICATINQAKLISHKATELGIRIPEPIYVSALKDSVYGSSFNFKEVLIDELDYVIELLLSEISNGKVNSVDTITTSSDIQELKINKSEKYISQMEKNFKDVIDKRYMVTFKTEAGFNKTIKAYCEEFNIYNGINVFYSDEEGFYMIPIGKIIEMRPIK